MFDSIDKKQLIHVVVEFVVLVALTFYFSSKTKKLNNLIEDLSQRLEEHEEQLQKQEQMIKQLIAVVNSSPARQIPTVSRNVPSRQPVHSFSPAQQEEKYSQPQTSQPQTSQRQPKRKSKRRSPVRTPPPVVIEEDESDEEDALDQEIAEELEELNDNLKKEQ
jgi:hypothetical protein